MKSRQRFESSLVRSKTVGQPKKEETFVNSIYSFLPKSIADQVLTIPPHEREGIEKSELELIVH